jgi:hypothetical protein
MLRRSVDEESAQRFLYALRLPGDSLGYPSVHARRDARGFQSRKFSCRQVVARPPAGGGGIGTPSGNLVKIAAAAVLILISAFGPVKSYVV